MSIRVYVDGAIFPPESAKIPVFDRGFLFGESVFETVGTVRGRLFAFDEHMERLARSAERIGLGMPARADIHAAVLRTIAAAGNPESRVRIVLTQGSALQPDGRVDLAPLESGPPHLVVIAQPLHPPPQRAYEEGVAVEIVSVTRNHATAIDPSVKSGNYLNNVLALRQARQRRPDAHEAILCAPGGAIAEGATSNVFMVRGETVSTPALAVGILAGVTRQKVIDLCRANGIACREVELTPAELRAADEVFITSAGRGVLPVTLLDGEPVGDRRPGPVTRRLMALYRALTERDAPPPTGSPS